MNNSNFAHSPDHHPQNLKFFRLKLYKQSDSDSGSASGEPYPLSTEGDIKAALKELNLQDAYTKSGTQLVRFLREELLSQPQRIRNSSAVPLPTNDEPESIQSLLALTKTLVEFHASAPRSSPIPSSSSPRNQITDQTEPGELNLCTNTSSLSISIVDDKVPDPYFTNFLQPILPNLLQILNQTVYPHCSELLNQLELSGAAASESEHSSIGTTTHQILCLIHKTTRITLSLLKRILLQSQFLESSPISQQLKILNEILAQFLRNEKLELSLDIKCNIGLGICYIMKIQGDSSINELGFYEKLFHKTEFPFLQNMSTDINLTINRLSLVFGLLETSRSSDPNFLEKMKVIGKFLFSIDHGTREGINLGSARVLELWIRKLIHLDQENLQLLVPLFPEIEFFIFSYLPGHIDAVKNCCRNILCDLVKIYEKLDQNHLVNLFNQVMTKPSHIKWIGVACICETSSKSLRALETWTDLPVDLLCSERTMKNPATDAYLALMSYHFTELNDPAKWKSIWINPLFTEQKVNTSESNWPQKRTIMNSILKSKNQTMVQVVLEFVLIQLKSFDNREGDLSSNSTESILLAVESVKLASELKIQLKESGTIAQNQANDFHGIVPRHVLHSWLWSHSLQIRLASFSLLVDSKKTSELIPSEDLESIKILLKYSIVSQNPAFRQQFISYYKRLLKRLFDSRNHLIRTKDSRNLEHYRNFLNWLWNFLVHDEGLFPGSNFGRRYQTLECLAELTSTFEFNLFGVEEPKDLELLRWFVDSYETNKVLAFRILEKVPLPALENVETTKTLLETVFRFCESTKPPDSVTGRFLALFLIKKCPTEYPPIKILNLALNKLENMFELIGKSSLIQVASKTQMYGYIRLIRGILTDESNSKIIDTEIYREFTKKLIELCIKFNLLLLPVLGNAAPEGFLPGLPDSSPQSSNIIRSLNAQMLLVCSWRSMKDLCLLLTDLCIVLPLETDAEEGKFIITLEQVQRIGDHLLYLLKNLMHRGVFEQAYIGFRQLGARLFRSNSRRLNEFPEKWLNDAMDKELINSKCITRRSAGLPFIFQALLYPLCGNDSLLAKYINRLFIPEFQEIDKENPNSTLVRIHCSNVLRGLFRDAFFSRGIMPYVPQGFQTAFRALKAPTWDERNSGLMLYGAVIRRTFGPKLNLMSAPTFFRKFPSMYDFLIDELGKCLETSKNPNSPEFDLTYHVLLLLSSFASTGVVEDGHFKLAEYVPLIASCGSSKDILVRHMAGKALIPFLIHPHNKIEFLMELLKGLETRKVVKTNQLHGDLIQFNLVLRSIPSETEITSVIQEFNRLLNPSHWIWTSKCPLIYETLANICLFDIPAFRPILNFTLKYYNVHFGAVKTRSLIPGLPNADEIMWKAFILSESDAKLFGKWFEEKDLQFVNQLILFLLTPQNSELLLKLSFSFLNPAIRKYLTTTFPYQAQSNMEQNFLELCTKFPSFCYAQLSPDHQNHLFSRLVEICEIPTGTVDIKGYAVTILGKIGFLNGNFINMESMDKFCNLLSNWVDSTCDVDLRVGVAKALSCIGTNELGFKNFTLFQKCQLWFTILSLAQDDDMGVREIAHCFSDSISATAPAAREQPEICDRKFLEDTIAKFLTIFGPEHPAESIVLLIGIVLREDFEIKVLDTDDNDDDRLFDKSEMNNFNEPILLLKILKETMFGNTELKTQLKHHFQNTPLTDQLLDIYNLCSNSNLANSTTLEFIAKNGLKVKSWDPYSTDSQFERIFIQSYICRYILDLFD